MSRQNQKSSWPLLCILGCLFILSAVATRTWERLDRSQPSGETAGPETASAGTAACCSRDGRQSPSSAG